LAAGSASKAWYSASARASPGERLQRVFLVCQVLLEKPGGETDPRRFPSESLVAHQLFRNGTSVPVNLLVEVADVFLQGEKLGPLA
jgi:hypothetical protein